MIAATSLSAWVLALAPVRRRPMPLFRPVASLLTWIFAAGLARAALQNWVTRPARAILGDAPYQWPVVVAYHLDEALHLAGPAAIVLAAVAVFARRRPWLPVVLSWAALAFAFAIAYPELRGDSRDIAHAVVSTASALVVGSAAWTSLRRRVRWEVAHLAIIVLASTELAVTVVVGWWPDPREHWEIARRVQSTSFALLLCGQLWHTFRGRWSTT